ncbi:MAG TPA: PDZ domain-containing protein [Longimicrobiales bacterium]|nr:PDZ domain-containing protein [Longimicrobiales bacterium]
MPRRTLTRIAIAAAAALAAGAADATAQEARLLRQPTIAGSQIGFEYGGDLWIVGKDGGEARRLTSTPAFESDPHLSPDGRWIAFTSTRTGTPAVYVMPVEGGDAKRLTWHPAAAYARGWSPDGKEVVFASERDAAPVAYDRLWTVPAGGGLARMLPAYMGERGAFAPDGRRLVVDRVDRWDVEFRNYRGGQNTPLTILDLRDLSETRLPNEDRTTDTQPVWLGGTIYFLSDRDYATNVWGYDVASRQLRQVTHFADADVKSLDGAGDALVVEQDGYLHLVDPASGQSKRLAVTLHGEFPWATPHWTDVSASIASASLSPSGKRALFGARGEVFTVPVEKGDARNLTRSPGAADRAPIWSPDGKQVAWFSDRGQGYRLLIGAQDGLTPPREIPLGDVKMAWTPAWSPDGGRIAFVDDHARLRVLEVATGRLTTADTDQTIWDRDAMAPAWSPDSRWLAYSKLFPNQYRRIVVWSLADGKARPVTDPLAHAVAPEWDRGGRYLYFLASTDLGLASAFANLSSEQARPTYGVYAAVLRATDPSPFPPESDEEAAAAAVASSPPPTAGSATKAAPTDSAVRVQVDFDRIERRIVPVPMPVRDYASVLAGPAGVLFVVERVPNQPAPTIHRFDVKTRKADVFLAGASNASISADGKKMLVRTGRTDWSIVGTEAPPKPGDGKLRVALQARLDPAQEWPQIFEEAWRIERDFFYASNLHGADWNAVHARYAPLVPFVRHREDLTYLLDQLGGELSVGHSFTGGGDRPAVDTVRAGLLGADLAVDGDRWKIARILTNESWNPDLRAPLDAPGVRAAPGNYLLSVNGVELTARDDPWRLLEGTVDRQTVLRLNDRPTADGSWTVTVVPVRSENALRQRAWVEDNRRKVEQLSGGRLAYVWVPNTAGAGFVSFNRYFFSQQDREGAVVDERFNQGGALDDYMVDLMGRHLIGGVSNEVAGAPPFRLPAAGVLGPKVLVTNELAGSGGDYFPWAFRQLKLGPLIGTRTWGGLVAACVPYPLVDGGYITSPCGAVYDARSHWVAENEGVQPDVEVLQDAKAVADGRDPQLEKAVAEALRLLATNGEKTPPEPALPVKARRPEARKAN